MSPSPFILHSLNLYESLRGALPGTLSLSFAPDLSSVEITWHPEHGYSYRVPLPASFLETPVSSHFTKDLITTLLSRFSRDRKTEGSHLP